MALTNTTLQDLYASLGRSFNAGNINITANKTAGTVSNSAEVFVQDIGVLNDASRVAVTTEIHDAVAGASKAPSPLLAAGQSFNSAVVQTPVQNLVIQTIKADNQQANDGSLTAVKELIRQMAAVSPAATLDASEPTVSTVVYGTDFNATSASSANNGDGVLNASTKRGDGLVNEHILPEDIEGVVTSVSANGQASFQLKGEVSVPKMSPDWPGGSGITTTLTSNVAATGTNLVNGSFEVVDTNATDLPAGWISLVGKATLGTADNDTFTTTPIEVQTISVTGPPTAGYFVVTFVDKDSNSQDTVQLVYNASASALQSALRNLDGLGEVTVSTTGTIAAETYVFTITMTGVTNPGQFTIDEQTTAGVYTPATTTAASATVMRGARSIQFMGEVTVAELTSIAYPVVLQPTTVYAVSIWVNNGNDVAAGAINIDLVDSTTSPAQISDDQSVVNELGATVVTGDLSTWTQWTMFFRTPTIMPNSVFLRIHVTTALTDDKTVNFDELVMVPATELYPGGPFAAIFTGPTNWVEGDVLRFSPANAQAGELHTWMDRTFDLSSNRLLIGSATGAAETIADTHIT